MCDGGEADEGEGVIGGFGLVGEKQSQKTGAGHGARARARVALSMTPLLPRILKYCINRARVRAPCPCPFFDFAFASPSPTTHLLPQKYLFAILLTLSTNSPAVNLHQLKEAHTDSMQFHTFQASSYVNGSYNYLLRSPYFVSDVFNREYDIAKNGFRLQQAYLSLSSMGEGFGGYASVVAGLDAYALAPFGWNADVFNLDNVGLTIVEAYMQYRHQAYTFQIGELSTLASFEAYDYRQNTNFSRSILNLNAEPGQHSGVRLIRRLNERVGLIVGMGNGWSTIHHLQQLNTLDAAVSLDKHDTYSMLLTGYIGPQYLTDNASTGPKGVRSLLVLFGSYQLTKPLSAAFSLDYGNQTKAALPYHVINRANWAGLAGYVNYRLNECWRVSVRGEIFNDSDGYRTQVRQNLKELTLTLGLNPIKNLSFLLETRHDFSNVNAFAYKNAAGGNSNQQSYAIEGLYQFL